MSSPETPQGTRYTSLYLGILQHLAEFKQRAYARTDYLGDSVGGAYARADYLEMTVSGTGTPAQVT